MPADRGNASSPGTADSRKTRPRKCPVKAGQLNRYSHPVASMLIGYARCSTDAQDLTAQRDALTALGVKPTGFT